MRPNVRRSKRGSLRLRPISAEPYKPWFLQAPADRSESPCRRRHANGLRLRNGNGGRIIERSRKEVDAPQNSEFRFKTTRFSGEDDRPHYRVAAVQTLQIIRFCPWRGRGTIFHLRTGGNFHVLFPLQAKPTMELQVCPLGNNRVYGFVRAQKLLKSSCCQWRIRSVC